MREGPLPDDSTLDRYREEITRDRGNEQVKIAEKDAKAIAKESDEVDLPEEKAPKD